MTPDLDFRESAPKQDNINNQPMLIPSNQHTLKQNIHFG